MDVTLHVLLAVQIIVVQVVQRAALVAVQVHAEQTVLQIAGTDALQGALVDAAAPARTQQNLHKKFDFHKIILYNKHRDRKNRTNLLF